MFSNLNGQHVIECFQLSHKYKLNELKENSINSENLREFFVFAHQYELTSVIDSIHSFIGQVLTVQNMHEYYVFSKDFQSEAAKERVLGFMKRNADKVTVSLD